MVPILRELIWEGGSEGGRMPYRDEHGMVFVLIDGQLPKGLLTQVPGVVGGGVRHCIVG
jgi:hypothetical protein